jgi:glycosyltransferase involved in cell wall biosynthesis
MTRILLIGNYALDRQHSMLRYSSWLKSWLTDRGLKADLLQPSIHFGEVVAAAHPAAKWLGHIDKFLIFPLTVLRRASRYDIVHICDHSNAIYRRFARGKPVAVTCHDLIAIRSMFGEFGRQHRPRWSGRLLQKWILSCLRKVEFVCCVSENTRNDLERLAPNANRKCRIISNPVVGFSPTAAHKAARELQDAGIDPNLRFFLCVGSNLWYKNRDGIVRIFAEAVKQPQLENMHLLCAGAALSPELRSLVASLGIEARVREIVDPSPALLCALYSKAAALLFVSLCEGFGWPIIEAQASGCPVITSDREPMKSIAGDPAVVVDPTLPVEAARIVGERWEWLALQKDASIKNAASFSQEAAADEYAAFYDAVLKNNPSDTISFAKQDVL